MTTTGSLGQQLALWDNYKLPRNLFCILYYRPYLLSSSPVSASVSGLLNLFLSLFPGSCLIYHLHGSFKMLARFLDLLGVGCSGGGAPIPPVMWMRIIRGEAFGVWGGGGGRTIFLTRCQRLVAISPVYTDPIADRYPDHFYKLPNSF